MTVDIDAVRKATRALLIAIGEEPDREGLKETPARVARFWAEFYDGQDQPRLTTSFMSAGIDQVVIVSGIRIWSLCEHHLLPFWADITIAYLTGEKILGLSKFARISTQAASRLQVQERLIQQIATQVELATASSAVAVFGRGEHLCMSMRGIKIPSIMVSSVMLGEFKINAELRQEALMLCQIYGKQTTERL